jgi:hypothetical protein
MRKIATKAAVRCGFCPESAFASHKGWKNRQNLHQIDSVAQSAKFLVECCQIFEKY